ncbi:pentapeptide repeat-containing protein [Rhodomicrobium vannielii ATCC 17100]|uniref:pentapeptide repeat-containing protein n=1 Tax=Rhodomicrobium vannielii TaxID=1069 RepID=UPI0019194199|nr:pentapeptide repeat-containing protein [Rhodomicrobium vannielii ATCC 17100]
MNSDFSAADFSCAVFDECDFGGSFMQNAIFEGVQMIDCEGRGIHLSTKEKDAEWFIKSKIDPAFVHWE